MSKQYTVTRRGDEWHISPTGNDPALGSKLFVSDDELRPQRYVQEPCFYIEPCGQFTGGFYVPVKKLQSLLDRGLVVPYFYDMCDPERAEVIREEGLAFEICAESETDEADRIEGVLIQMGGFIQ